MQRQQRVRALWIALVGAVILSAVIVPLWVTADSGQVNFTATLYSDVIRFEADGVASLRVTIYDLSENELWSTGLVMGDFVDWDRANARGERLANGLYLYLAQGWDTSDTLILNKAGKVVLLPGDQVELKAAPIVSSALDGALPWEENGPAYGPMESHIAETWTFAKVGIGAASPSELLHVSGGKIRLDGTTYPGYVMKSSGAGAEEWIFFGDPTGFAVRNRTHSANILNIANGAPANALNISSSGIVNIGVPCGVGTSTPTEKLHVAGGRIRVDGTAFPFVAMQSSLAGAHEWAFFGTDTNFFIRDRTTSLNPFAIYNGAPHLAFSIRETGNIGIGTADAPDKLTIQYNGGDNAIAVYPGTSRASGAAVFRVESDGDVYADGIAYAANFITGGSADVAERINASEWVEAGDVVEIDPDHAGFFRKATGLYSRRVAGIISTSPGVILGNNIDPTTDQWDDNRPVLAIAGRVPVKASTENGPIAVGDLLVSSSVPGVAMRGDPAVSIGAVVGKAMEPLESGEGAIMAQVTLR